MKSYDELCAVARALDVVGERWTLLLVRELLIEPGLRFNELQRRLPGIAPNLLSQRLRDLEQNDVVTKDQTEAVTLYRLTPRGAQLEGVIRELLKWGAPTVPAAPPDAHFQMHWLSMPARYLLRDNEPGAPPVVVRFGSVADGFDVRATAGVIDITPCAADRDADAVVQGPGLALVGLVQGAVPLDAAARAGVSVTGDRRALVRVLPASPAGPPLA